ncbi:MAG: hypothetical protein AAGJ31_15815, partial [Verrucomicrobiota bacterium]
ANAFLKTLEEPPQQCLLLLLTGQPEQLLDTIRSRCIRVSLFQPGGVVLSDAENKLLEALTSGLNRQGKGVAGPLGLMQRFVSILKEEKEALAKRYQAELREESAAYKQTTEGDWLKQREAFYKALTEAQYLGIRDRLVDLLLTWYGDVLRLQAGSSNLDLPNAQEALRELAKQLDQGDLLRRIEALSGLRESLATNVQEGLALEVSFLQAFQN